MRRQKVNTLSALLLLLALLSGCAGTVAAPPEPEPTVPPGALLTIDGYAVPTEEFMLFLLDQRALTAAHFSREYGAEIDADFWQRSFNGQTPTDYAKQKALEALLAEKMVSILSAERGLVEDISYEALMADMAETNADRAEKLETGEVFYGLTEYDAAAYYAYVSSLRRGELLRSQPEYSAPTQEQLRQVYNDRPDYFTSFPVYTCSFLYEDGTSEELEVSVETVHKEDAGGGAFLEALAGLSPGDTLPGNNQEGRRATVTLLSTVPGAPLPFEDASTQSLLVSLFEESELYELLRKRCADAKIVFDRATYDALTIG